MSRSARGGPRPIGVGVIGLGFMGRTHLAAFRAAHEAGFENLLVAVCDADPARRRGEGTSGGNIDSGADRAALFDPAEVAGYERAEDLIADERVDLVSICTPTDSHVSLALAALEASKHVLVEKPLARTAAAIEPLLAAARSAGTRCMPAHCMRFWPAWRWLVERIRSADFGAVRSASFRRLASPPAWAPEFYRDPKRTGGALIDLHVHDADFVRFAFGEPVEVSSTGDLDHVTTLYRFERGPVHVVAEGGWDHDPGFPFRMRYTVVFERATADFDMGRDPELVLYRDGVEQTVEVDPLPGYDHEIRHLLAAIVDPTLALDVTIEDAWRTARLLDAERASQADGAPRRP